METGENNPELIIANDFSIILTEQYHLSIELSLVEFKFVILDTKDLEYKYLEICKFKSTSIDDIADELRTTISESKILNNTFSSSSIAYSRFPSTLIPVSVYRQEDENTILSLHSDIFKCTLRDTLPSQDAKLIYSIPEKIKSTIDNFFPKIKSKSHETILIKAYEKLNKNKPTAYININKKYLLITIFKHNKLIFNNSFQFFTKEDILYYILFSFEQLKLSTEKTRVILFGEIDYKKEYKLMYEYIRDISFGKRNNTLIYNEKFNILEKYHHFGLFSQVVCA